MEELRDSKVPSFCELTHLVLLKEHLGAQRLHVASQVLGENIGLQGAVRSLFLNSLSLEYVSKASALAQGLSNMSVHENHVKYIFKMQHFRLTM